MNALSLEVKMLPSLCQVIVGGGMALVSQYRVNGLLTITSLLSPVFSITLDSAFSKMLDSFGKFGGTRR